MYQRVNACIMRACNIHLIHTDTYIRARTLIHVSGSYKSRNGVYQQRMYTVSRESGCGALLIHVSECIISRSVAYQESGRGCRGSAAELRSVTLSDMCQEDGWGAQLIRVSGLY